MPLPGATVPVPHPAAIEPTPPPGDRPRAPADLCARAWRRSATRIAPIRSRLRLGESLAKVCDQIGWLLDPAAEAHEIGGDGGV